MTDDGRGADVITLPMLNLSPPGDAPDDGVPPPPEAGDLAPPPDFFLPFPTPGDDDDSSTVDPDDIAPQMVANASSGTGTPARATASMAMVTMAAIAVAALRGTWSMANYLKARREHHDAVADKAREAADKQKVANAAAGAKKAVQPGPEFGRGATSKGGGRSGGSGASGGSGRGTFGQQQKPSPKSGGRGSSANGSTGAGGRGSGSGAGPRGSQNGTAGGGSRTSGPGSSGKGSKGAAGGGTGSSGTGSGSSKSSPSGAKKSPGTLGKLATGRQQRKNDDAKARRQAEAEQRKADLADRAAARKEAAAEAADRRKRKAEKRKTKRERERAGGTGPKDPKETNKGKPDEKIDLTKKPKADDGTGATKDDTEKIDLTKKPKPGSSKGGAKTKKTPKPPRKKKPRSWRRKPKGSTTGPKTGRRRRKGRTTSDPGSMPGGDGEWLRPPPGWDVIYTVEDVRAERRRRQPAGSITTGRRELPAGSSGQVTPTRSVPKESPIVMGTAAAIGEVGDTQFVDADLTVYDLIESDEEMGEQILQGVDHMNLVAAKCEGLKSGLESLYAMCIEKKVPGVLVKWTIRLMERAGSVQDKAEALRDSLPRASEAILAARDTAIEADKLRADRVKEAGHVAPAEREYHDRSGA
ncbi:hypothetical protein [Streptomyces scabiei]|uniref:hypothetical protein n=1 Tax=Streptomyces scabiei TaxID=1930 RepID=UPI0029B761F5|nr:hypothetical protein [Streptomyces scabiei]MDX3523715.1 hypothetical protein [Streptomyces scabiei]